MTGPNVDHLMRRNPVTTSLLDTLANAQSLMEREGFRQLPVVENGKLIGMLSDRDLHAHSGYLERTKVDAAMTERLITVAPTDSAAHVAHLLLEQRINAVPVVDKGRLVGIVSRSDLLRLLIDLVEGHNVEGT
jgi:CBS domain-containing protein